MAKKKTKKNTHNMKGVTKATARPTHAVGESKNSPIGEVRRLLATAAFIREMWVARQIPQPVFDGDPTPLPSEEILGRRPTESEYAAATAILLADEFGHDRLWSEIVDKRGLIAKALHLGIEPDELAAWIDIQHRTIPAEAEPEEGYVLLWRYAEWDSKEDWARGAEWHTAMYNTNRTDIISIGGFGGFVTYEEVEVPIGSYEHTSAKNNAQIGRRA